MFFRSALVASTVMMMTGAAQAESVTAEVIHWWTAGGEAAAVGQVVKGFENAGGKWVDSPVPGGDAARTAATSRIVAGQPPTAMQWHLGKSLKELDDSGTLGDVSSVAAEGGWDKLLPSDLYQRMKPNGKVVAAPINMHGINWMWANKAVLEEVGIDVPKTWDEFNMAAEKVKAAGYVPLAFGGQPWQEALTFTPILLGIAGPDLYRRVLIDHDLAAFEDPKVVAAFEQFAKMRDFVDAGSSGRDWNLATAMVIEGKAAFQFMGDWAKGEFIAANKEPGRDYLCAIAPGNSLYMYNSDAFAFSKVSDDAQLKGQAVLARTVMDKDVQKQFNLRKGSIPARVDIDMDQFDICAQAGAKMVRSGQSIPGTDLTLSASVAGAYSDAMTQFFNSRMTAAEGAKLLRDAIANAM